MQQPQKQNRLKQGPKSPQHLLCYPARTQRGTAEELTLRSQSGRFATALLHSLRSPLGTIAPRFSAAHSAAERSTGNWELRPDPRSRSIESSNNIKHTLRRHRSMIRLHLPPCQTLFPFSILHVPGRTPSLCGTCPPPKSQRRSQHRRPQPLRRTPAAHDSAAAPEW